jgi:hypothetical protein
MNRGTKMKPGNVLTQVIDDEMVVLNLDNEKYFTLDSVATRFWDVVLEHGHGAEAVSVLLEEYDVDRDILQPDLDLWVEEMITLGLLVRHESAT